jgi:1-acyl-sn-glycerol-3-phosphate acyltransferase
MNTALRMLFALIQTRTDPAHLSRTIAGMNIMNALFMVSAALLAMALLSMGLSIPQIFMVAALMNAVVALYIFLLVPEFLMRFFAWMLIHTLHRVHAVDTDRIPEAGPAVLVCNHVSYMDALVIAAASPRPIRFVMDHRIFRIPVLGWLFRLARAIPIAPQKEDPAAYAAAFERAAQVLREGDLLAIFPEGAITSDGELKEFKAGIMKILERARADGLEPPVVPMALTNLWGSFFSRVEQGRAMVRPFRRGAFTRVGLNVGEAMPAGHVQPEALRQRVAQLLTA